MDDNIRAEIERVLEVRGHEGVVHDQNQVVAFCNIRHLSDVGYVHHRVRRSFDVDCFCIFFDVVFRVFLCKIDPAELNTIFLINMIK